jgi:hypothetical protein
MKKIYFAHSSGFDFKKDLYLPIRNSKLNSQYNFIFPHEHGLRPLVKNFLRHVILFLQKFLLLPQERV